MGWAPIDVPHRHLEALRATAFLDHLHTLHPPHVHATARGLHGEPKDARHGHCELSYQRSRRVCETASSYGGAIVDMCVAWERGLVEESGALVVGIRRRHHGGTQRLCWSWRRSHCPWHTMALRHRKRGGGSAWFCGSGATAAACSGQGCVEVGECEGEGSGGARAH
jgi:hypothetical protein